MSDFIECPKNIHDHSLIIGEYRGWEISIGVARGEDYDILSANARNYGTSFCSSFGRYVPCERDIPRPLDSEAKEAVAGLKRSIDNYEEENSIPDSDLMKYKGRW
jgi:predicted ATP-grasp superfamily ATP-dependent carboligase